MQVREGKVIVCLFNVRESLVCPVDNIALEAFLRKHKHIILDHIAEELCVRLCNHAPKLQTRKQVDILLAIFIKDDSFVGSKHFIIGIHYDLGLTCKAIIDQFKLLQVLHPRKITQKDSTDVYPHASIVVKQKGAINIGQVLRIGISQYMRQSFFQGCDLLVALLAYVLINSFIVGNYQLPTTGCCIVTHVIDAELDKYGCISEVRVVPIQPQLMRKPLLLCCCFTADQNHKEKGQNTP